MIYSCTYQEKEDVINLSLNDVTIVFCSCDAYSDLWENFFKLLKKYWPEYDGKIILNTESKEFQYEGMQISKPLNCARTVSWSDRLSLSLQQVKTPYVLIFLDDFYLKNQVNHEGVIRTLEYMKSYPNVVSITYLKEPGGKKEAQSLDGFVNRAQFSLYKMTAHITMYKTEYLQKILKNNESAWEFEVNGTIRSWFKRGRFLCPIENSNPIFSYDFGSLVIRGKYLRPIKEYFEDKEGCVFSKKRAVMEEWVLESNGSVGAKVKYLVKVLLSICKKRAL